MSALRKGLLLAALQVALVSSLGVKLLIDRRTLPRAWVKTVPFDPNLPIRGRYASLALQVRVKGSEAVQQGRPVALLVEADELVAIPTSKDMGVRLRPTRPGGDAAAVLSEPVPFFLPEHASDPSRRPAGEELWVEVSVPPKGMPRPIRLGVRKGGVLTPLD